jgi:enterochelin esterase-like enzyme
VALRIVPRLLLALGLATASCRPAPTGRFDHAQLHSAAEGRAMRYGVLLPPGWDGVSPLPIVVLLHGAGDDETSADREAVVSALDEAVRRGDVPPFILVTPDGDFGFWMNWYDGSHRYRDLVLEEVVPAVRATYPTVEGRAGLHLMGVSMGGGGGLQMWLHDPTRFASATIISAPILDEEETRRFLRRFMPKRAMQRVFGPPGSGVGVDPYVALRSPEALGGSVLIFGAAERDRGGILASNRRFHAHLEAHGVPHHFAVFPGRHDWSAWAPMFAQSLQRAL